MTSPNSPKSIAIIGAGIGGITLAIAISKSNPHLRLTIYESRSAFSEIGAGVSFGPNAVQAMTLIDPEISTAYNKIKTSNLSPEKSHVWFDIRYGNGPRAGEFITEIASAKGFTHCGASRSHFLDGLVKLIPEDVGIAFGKKLLNVTENELGGNGPMRVKFEDGTEVNVDAVIGCDGIRSVCRQILLGPDDHTARAVYSGKYAYRGVVDMAKAVEAGGQEVVNRQVFVGEGGHLLMFPIKNGRSLNIVAFRDAEKMPWIEKQWVVPSSREALLKDFTGWAPSAMGILELIQSPDKWALFEHLPAPTYAKGNFCILGDAAHATTPHCGAGAGFAIEDAYILAGLLSSEQIKSSEDISRAFRVYDESRRPRSQQLVTRSHKQGETFDLQGPNGIRLTEQDLKHAMTSTMAWVWNNDLVATLNEAKLRLAGI